MAGEIRSLAESSSRSARSTSEILSGQVHSAKQGRTGDRLEKAPTFTGTYNDKKESHGGQSVCFRGGEKSQSSSQANAKQDVLILIAQTSAVKDLLPLSLPNTRNNRIFSNPGGNRLF